MAVYFKGLNLLDSNRYDTIMIRGVSFEGLQNFQIDIKELKPEFIGSKEYLKFKGERVAQRFSLSLKEMTDEQKIVEVVKKYLEYSSINEIRDFCHLSNYKGWFNVVKGTRNLYMQTYGFSDKLMQQLIIKKYIEDRLKFIADNEFVNSLQIELGYHLTSYKKEQIDNNERISLKLFSKDNKVSEFEQQFLKELIFNKLYQQAKEAELKHITSNEQFTHDIHAFGYYITCGDLLIQLNGIDTDINLLLEQIKAYIVEYNKQLKNSKILQLKVEGF